MNGNINFYGQIKHLEPDFVIISQNDKEIRCHKFILANRSQVRRIHRDGEQEHLIGGFQPFAVCINFKNKGNFFNLKEPLCYNLYHFLYTIRFLMPCWT